MRKEISIYIMVILGWFCLSSTAFALAEVKSLTTVSGSTVTLGDLLDNLDHGHDIWVINSPAPGKKTTISTRYLATLTKEHKVYWQNSRAVKYITVTRKSKSIKHRELEALIKNRLKETTSDQNKLGIQFENKNAQIYLSEDDSFGDIAIKDIQHDPRTSKFVATLSLPGEQDGERSETVRGRTYSISYVPALNKTIAPGNEIANHDIKWVSMPTLRIGRNIIRNKDQLIGMTPRRGLKPSTPIKLSDLQRPDIVKREKMVSILFKSGKISLTAIGKAVESGGRGDMIRVMNAKSHKTVDAIVIGPGQVQVVTAQRTIIQNPIQTSQLR